MSLDLLHGIAVIKMLAAGRTFVKLYRWDDIGLALVGPLEVTPNCPELPAPTTRTFCQIDCHYSVISGDSLRRHKEIIRIFPSFCH
jgi:hypothetical protein